ncbi:MAG: hypothetical protein IJ371_02090 [Clostridia bacterium]|nr:hypothetical protein [Clostridia bacterium]
MLSLMELMDWDPYEEARKNKRKNKLCKRRLIAKRILLGSSLALAIGFTSGMMSSTIHQNKIDSLRKEQDKMYEQYMQSDEFETHASSQVVKLAEFYHEGQITFEDFKVGLEKIYSTENADKLLEGSSHELKADIEHIEDKITETNQKFASSAINIGSIGLFGAGVAAAIPSAIAFTHYDLKTVAKSKIAIEYQEYETGPVLVDKKSSKKKEDGLSK